MSNNDPDQIRAEIERTRANLSDDVNALTYEAKPSTMAKRQVGRVRGAMGRAKEAVMGTTSQAGSSMTSSVGGAVSSAGDAVTSVPDRAVSQTRGNPVAAGLVAFGVGALVASLIPATEKERELAGNAKDAAAPLAHKASEAAKEAVDQMREPVADAVQSVKGTAEDAAGTVADEGKSAAQEVRSGRDQQDRGSTNL